MYRVGKKSGPTARLRQLFQIRKPRQEPTFDKLGMIPQNSARKETRHSRAEKQEVREWPDM